MLLPVLLSFEIDRPEVGKYISIEFSVPLAYASYMRGLFDPTLAGGNGTQRRDSYVLKDLTTPRRGGPIPAKSRTCLLLLTGSRTTSFIHPFIS